MTDRITNRVVTFVLSVGVIILGTVFKPEIVDYVRAVSVMLIAYSTIPDVKSLWQETIDYISYAEMVALELNKKADTTEIANCIELICTSIIFILGLLVV